MKYKSYLGDGVYAAVDERGIVLTTEDGLAADNTIILEPDVYRAFMQWVARVRKSRDVETP